MSELEAVLLTALVCLLYFYRIWDLVVEQAKWIVSQDQKDQYSRFVQAMNVNAFYGALRKAKAGSNHMFKAMLDFRWSPEHIRELSRHYSNKADTQHALLRRFIYMDLVEHALIYLLFGVMLFKGGAMEDTKTFAVVLTGMVVCLVLGIFRGLLRGQLAKEWLDSADRVCTISDMLCERSDKWPKIKRVRP